MTNKGQMDLPFVSFCKNVWSQSKRLDEVFDKDDANGWIYIYIYIYTDYTNQV